MNPTFPLEQGYLQHHIKATLPLFGQVLKSLILRLQHHLHYPPGLPFV